MTNISKIILEFMRQDPYGANAPSPNVSGKNLMKVVKPTVAGAVTGAALPGLKSAFQGAGDAENIDSPVLAKIAKDTAEEHTMMGALFGFIYGAGKLHEKLSSERRRQP